MSKLTVIGNAFLDIIDIINYDGKYQRKIQDGGIWNVPLGQDGQLVELRKGTANILVTRHGTESSCNFGHHVRVSEQSAYKYEHDWCHLAYANLCEIDFAKVKAKTKSCDLTKHWFVVDTSQVMKNAACCDYVFLSQSDDHKILKTYLLKEAYNFRGWIIEHSEQGSVALQRKTGASSTAGTEVYWQNLSHYSHERKNFLFTVGAGDRFAGYFIQHRMENPESLIKNSQEYAHTKTIKWLEEENANI